LAFLGFLFKIFDFHDFVIGFTVSYLLPFLIIFLFLLKSGQVSLQPQFGFLDKSMIKTLSSVSLFGLISYSTDIIVFNIDRIMIERLIGLSNTGIYSTAFLFGSIVMVPSRSLFKISTAVIADAWKNSDYKSLGDIYKKSCLNQFLIGILIFLLIAVNLENIMQILPVTYADGKNVIMLISLAMLFNMIIGINGVLIMTSKEYRMNTYLLFLLAALIFILNLVFIPKYGILGSAIATVISKFVINLIRAVYVKWKFGFQPYNYKFGIILVIVGLLYVVHLLLPVFDNFIIDILIRSLLISMLFVLMNYALKTSDELNGIIRYSYSHLRNIFKS
jgi:O-antigen/teichoic acid export membrane protein